jgi:alkanesulfonate monooxygenase SsuD/methylene tetrahydromethanopterin reductase-like flavin-dependent oxidoreductase (luciferase family)
MPPTIGVVCPPWFPPEDLVGTAQAAEAAGIAQLWLWEDCFSESGIAAASAALASTSRLQVRVGLMPVPLRNVALTAMEVATMARMFPGRFQHVVGHGVLDWMGQVGARVESPLTLLREYVDALDRLLAGDEVTVEGRYVRLDQVRLAYPPAAPFATWAAGDGEKTLSLIGEIASGVLIDSGTSPARAAQIIALLQDSRSRVGRSDVPDIALYARVFRGPDARAGYEATVGALPSDPGDLQGLVGSADEIAEGVRRYADAGVGTVVLQAEQHETDLHDFVAFVAGEIAPRVA